jgi:hypothetical protein
MTETQLKIRNLRRFFWVALVFAAVAGINAIVSGEAIKILPVVFCLLAALGFLLARRDLEKRS